jgi:hypothetical protein
MYEKPKKMWRSYCEYDNAMRERKIGFLAAVDRVNATHLDWIIEVLYKELDEKKASEYIGRYKSLFMDCDEEE